MQRPLVLLVLAAAVVSWWIAPAWANRPDQSGGTASALARPALPLGHAGRWVTDAKGRVVILHGVNMVYKLPPYYPAVVGFDEDDAAFLASEGFNSVRVGIIYKGIEPQPSRYDEAYLDRIEETVDVLARRGIVSMLDFHQDLYNERFQGEGWPDWAVQDDGLPPQPMVGFPYNYAAMPALWRAFDHFWENSPGPEGVGLQDSYGAAWRHVAMRFRANPSVLGYELMNEPWAGSQWPSCANPFGCPLFDETMARFIVRTVAAIRNVDSRTLMWYEPQVLFNNGADTNVGDIGDPRAGFAFHDYCLNTETNLGCDPFDDLVFANAESHVAETGDAILLTEFGATDAADILTAMVERADENMVGWQYWAYCGCGDPTTSGPGDIQAIVIDPSKPPAGDNVKEAKLQVLSRPYPAVVSGIPLGYGFDAATRTFHLRYATARADGTGSFPPGAVTQVILPARQYPAGYEVDVEGATIRSGPGAQVLRLEALPGVGEISVTVTPA